jgi:hypothetical protein
MSVPAKFEGKVVDYFFNTSYAAKSFDYKQDTHGTGVGS